jgi:cytochrome c5
MANHHESNSSNSFVGFFAVLGGILLPMLVLTLIVKLFIAPAPNAAANDEAAVAARIKPVAEVEVAAEQGSHVDKSGEEVYNTVCMACHAVGALGSPKFGDNAAWAPRIAQGYDTLVSNATNGIRTMPARGGNADLTDLEVARAVAYMANQSGADFKAE